MTEPRSLDDVLSRADSSALRELLGPETVGLIQALDERLTATARLRELLGSLYSPQELLLQRGPRNVVFGLLRQAEAERLCERLGAATGDPYQSLPKVRFSAGSRSYMELLSFFKLGHPRSESGAVQVELDAASADYPLFAHQRAALHKLRALLLKRPYRSVLHMPTGSGKTRTAMNYVAEHLRLAEPTVVYWLAASEELCDQAVEEFLRAWKTLGNREVEVHRFWGGRDLDPHTPRDGIVVASLATVYSRHNKTQTWAAFAGDKASLVVMDEAHQAVAETYKFVLEALLARGEATQLLGLTATPGRTWNDVHEDERLADFFCRRRVKLEVPGYENPVDYLIAEGYLARPTFRQIESASTKLSESEQQKLALSLEIPEAVLKRLANDEVRSVQILRAVEDLARRHDRIILFATSADHATRLAAVLQATGTEARAILGSTSATSRQANIRWFKRPSDECRVLVNYGVLTTGFDAPRTSAAVIARPTKSLVLFSQMVGRATRGIRAGGNREAEIVTIVDVSLPGFGNMSTAFENWEDVWQ